MERLNFKAEDLQVRFASPIRFELRDGRYIVRSDTELEVRFRPAEGLIYGELHFAIPMPGSWFVYEQSRDERYLLLYSSEITVVDLEKRKAMRLVQHVASIDNDLSGLEKEKCVFGPPGRIYRLNNAGVNTISYDRGELKLLNTGHNSEFKENRIQKIKFNGGSKILLYGRVLIVVDVTLNEWSSVRTLFREPNGKMLTVILPTPSTCIVYSVEDQSSYFMFDLNDTTKGKMHYTFVPLRKNNSYFDDSGIVLSPDGKVRFSINKSKVDGGVYLKFIQLTSVVRKVTDNEREYQTENLASVLGIIPSSTDNVSVIDFRQTDLKKVVIKPQVGINYGLYEIRSLSADGTRLSFLMNLERVHEIVFPVNTFPTILCEYIYCDPRFGKDRWMRLMSDLTIDTDESWPSSLIKIDPSHPGVGIEVAKRWLGDISEGYNATGVTVNDMLMAIRIWAHNLSGQSPVKTYQEAVSRYTDYLQQISNTIAIAVGLY